MAVLSAVIRSKGRRHLLAMSKCVNSRYFSNDLPQFDAVSIESVKGEFKNYKGGSVLLSLEDSSGIATVTLCHPERRNAISGSMMCDLHDVVGQLEEWTEKGLGRALVLKSDDSDYFCSGADLKSTVRHISNSIGGFKLATLMHDNLTRLSKLPLISVTLVRGRAIGGGAELTLATDFRVFTPSGKINFVQNRLGVLPGWAGGSKLVSLVGRNKALELLLTCRPVNAEEASRIGLCDHVLESEDEAGCYSWIRTLIRNDRHVTSLTKELCDKFGTVPYDEALLNEKRLFASVWGGEANKKALEANLKHK